MFVSPFRHRPSVFRTALLALLVPLVLATGCGGGGGSPPPAGPGISYTTYTTGPIPRDVVMGDFNGDGKLDVATANEDGDLDEVVSLFIGDGNGGFAASQAVPPAGGGTWGPISLAVGDLNSDFRDDLVILYLLDDSYAVALGADDPTTIVVSAPVSLGAGTDPQAAITADFDGVAGLDLAVVNSWSDKLLIYSGNDDGTFSGIPTDTLATPLSPWDLAVGHFDTDANLDIVTVSLIPDATDPWVSVFAGNGAGGFVQATTADSSAPVEGDADVAVGNLNGDLYDDVVRTLYAENKVAVFFGTASGELANAAGTVGEHDEYAVGLTPSGVALADTDGDTFLDIVTSNEDGDSVTVLAGDGAGGFAGAAETFLPATPVAVATGDLDGDGHADIATTHGLSSDTLTIIPQ